MKGIWAKFRSRSRRAQILIWVVIGFVVLIIIGDETEGMDPDLFEQLPGRIESALTEILEPDETIEVQLKGAFKEGLVCTDHRLIIIKGGFMTGQTFGTNVFQVPYANITGVDVKKHMTSGYFEISTGGMQGTEKSYWSNKKGYNAKQAPNTVSIVGKSDAERFRKAA
jgi:Bacterial PH domain